MIKLKMLSLKLKEGITHEATDWQVAEDLLFENLVVDIVEDHEDKLKKLVDVELDPAKKYYGRARVLLNTGYAEWSNIDIFLPNTINEIADSMDPPTIIPVPVLSTNSRQNEHINTGFTITASGFGISKTSTHISTDWIISDIDGNMIWSDLDTSINKESVVVKDVILRPNKVYRIRAIFNSSSNDKSQVATYTIRVAGPKYIKLITPLLAVDVTTDTNIKIAYIPNLSHVEWYVKEITKNGLVEVWRYINDTGDFNDAVIPADTLSKNKRYMLMIKTNIEDVYFTNVFSTY